MIEEGEHAPVFNLPGVRDGEITQIDGAEFLGENIVVLAFYPGDFNPGCADGETGLDELDLFTMQKDVSVLALSGDSVYSHLAFADEYNLHMPLLSDIDGSVASAYGVAVDDESAGYQTERAVVVVDHAGTVQYIWRGDTPGAVPDAEVIRDAINEIGDEDTAQSRYRVGYARYMEGRRAFTSAMKSFELDEWMIAQTDFTQAADEFDEAGDEFNTAIRFAEEDETRTYFERAEKKAESLWRAADWLSQSAKAFSSGEGARGQSLRSDAESPLETARELHEPPDPDDFPPETDPAEETDETEQPFLPEEETAPAASLDADLDTAVAEVAEQRPGSEAVADVPAYGNKEMTRTRSITEAPAAARPRSYPEQEQSDAAAEQAEAEDDEESDIDDEELEAITAELEEQSEATSDPSDDAAAVPDELDAEYQLSDPLSDSVDSDDSVPDVDSVDDADESAQEDSQSERADDVDADDREDSTDDGVDESVVDDIYTGVVDVGSDVIEQVGGEMVDPDDDDSENETDTEGSATAEQGDAAEENAAAEAVDDEIDLDLTDPDPDDEDDEEAERDVSTGDHGVPDSL